MANQNTPEYLEKIKTRLFENLRMLPHAPGVQVQAIPEDALNEEEDDENGGKGVNNPDERISICASDKRVAPDNEFSDSEDEGEGGRRDHRLYKGRRKRTKLDEGNGENTERKEGTQEEEKMDADGTPTKEEIKTENEKCTPAVGETATKESA